MRGKLSSCLAGLFAVRIIPARAGQTHERKEMQKRASDHPRACGANQGAPADPWSQDGSSPRVRGKLLQFAGGHVAKRIIPARAGQTGVMTISSMTSPDHPRACGANSDGHRGEWGPDGSSPRVRGKRSRSCPPRTRRRIIPARAGQTPREWHQLIAGADHPRACGANSIGFRCAHSASGSSPRVRGKLMRIALMIMNIRIIPARAGQTDNITRLRGLRLDHPRACGANMDLNIANAYRPGSSPRVRGKLDPAHVYALYRRIIPARAGQTRRRPQQTSRPPDHPRACGANLSLLRMLKFLSGSSPRVRGKPPALVDKSGGLRIIPARAGQTFGSRS